MTNLPALPDNNPLGLTGRDLRLTELQAEMERLGEERGAIAYTSPLWAQFSFPHRDPGDVPRWEARNGKNDGGASLVLRRGEKRLPDGSWCDAGYPFGVIPRHTMTFLATEAKKTGNPVIELTSQRSFMADLGMTHGSRQRRALRIQLEALAACDIRVEEYGKSGSGWGYKFGRIPITSGLQLWLNNDGDDGPALWGSKIVLSPQFFESIMDAAMPLYIDALRAFGSSSLRHDIYIWLTYRLNAVTGPVPISWEGLQNQFGSGFTRLRDFRAKFVEALNDVLRVYDTARVQVTDTKLILLPSPAHIPPRRTIAPRTKPEITS